jgi:Flp pilus assembly protein TadG
MRCARGKARRSGAAAVEFGCCAPLIALLVLGLWEVGRMVEVDNVMWNSAREGARDASMGQSNLSAVASNVLVYLQGAEPTAFLQGDATSMISPVIPLGASSYGYTCWDNTANKELFTITFTDLTNPTVTDPTQMSQLDVYQITVSTPYSTVGWLPTAQVTGLTRLYVTVTWASMVDVPFSVEPYLAAQ